MTKKAGTGICTRCSKPTLQTSNSFCEKHLLQDISHKTLGTRTQWSALKTLLENQGHKCHYSGITLVLGYNASVDHVVPLVKGGGSKGIENLVWTDIRVNRMKRDLDYAEFLNLCYNITNNSLGIEPDHSHLPLVRGKTAPVA